MCCNWASLKRFRRSDIILDYECKQYTHKCTQLHRAPFTTQPTKFNLSKTPHRRRHSRVSRLNYICIRPVSFAHRQLPSCHRKKGLRLRSGARAHAFSNSITQLSDGAKVLNWLCATCEHANLCADQCARPFVWYMYLIVLRRQRVFKMQINVASSSFSVRLICRKLIHYFACKNEEKKSACFEIN